MLSNKVVITSAALLAALQNVKADSQEFSIVSIDSGTALQYSTALIDTDSATGDYFPITVGSAYGKPSWVYVVDDQGHLVANGTYYWGIIPNSEGQYGVTTDASKAVEGFSIVDGSIASAQGYSFTAVPDGSSWDLYSTNSDGNNGNTNNNLYLELAAFTSSGGYASDYEPSNSSNDSVGSSTSASKNATTLAPSSSYNSSTTVIPATSSAAVAAVNTSSVVATSTVASANQTSTANHTTSGNSTSSNSTKSSSTSSHKNGAEVTKGSLSLLAMGLAGLFL